ncbi:hypothetical protein PENCOP_c007G05048 [Penicillium coprophilum]|uniref:Uncharacterized protein n=1 Tax=Penicillium coprophilum TaxID=36646 RepID=A0A1V6UM13_9EURO|nr:hypothetical protein PENCOP_c007G05048 [Penicillium coprophilum]
MSSPAASKEKLFPGISATETKLLVLANVCLKNDRIDYDKLALNAGIKVSSAQTLFRNAKRKLDKLFGDDDANVDGNGAQDDLTPVETPSKRGKSNAKAKPRTPKTPKNPKTSQTPKTPKNPKTSQTPKTPKGSKGAVKFAESEDQDTVDPKLSATTTSADIFADDTTRETAVADPFTDSLAASGATDNAPKVNAGDKEDNGIANKSNKTNEDALDLAVNQQLPESPSPKVEDGAPYEDVQEDEEQDD